ncbi:serine/threonine-protein phosphatase 6 regulatory ankyrin repeat subunit B-like, partial [Rhagoletis pomonella]
MSESPAEMSSFQVDQRANFLALILLDALEDGNESDINAILERNNVDASFVPVERGISPLHYACGMENAELAWEISKRFLQDGADPNVRSNENMTPLHVAAIFGRVDIVKQLLKYGAQYDVVDDERKTPIHYAIEDCHFEVLEAIRNHIFQHKYDRDCQKRSNECRQDSNTPAPKTVRLRDENASNITPVNKVLRNVLATDN